MEKVLAGIMGRSMTGMAAGGCCAKAPALIAQTVNTAIAQRVFIKTTPQCPIVRTEVSTIKLRRLIVEQTVIAAFRVSPADAILHRIMFSIRICS
jgi:hypothetical protein